MEKICSNQVHFRKSAEINGHNFQVALKMTSGNVKQDAIVKRI